MLMKCGHIPQGDSATCVICVGVTPDAEVLVSTPDLTGRVARCSSCMTERPSSFDLPFFEYRGEKEIVRRSGRCGACGCRPEEHGPRLTGRRIQRLRGVAVAQSTLQQCGVCGHMSMTGQDQAAADMQWPDAAFVVRRYAPQVTLAAVCERYEEYVFTEPVNDIFYCGCRGWD